MKIAIVHEWLDTFAGSESVLAELLRIYPQADLYAVVDFMDEAGRARLGDRRARTTFIQTLPFARRHFRLYLPLMPLAIEQFDLSAYDLIISSSHAVAKGVITRVGQVHVSYVHSPMRYAWDLTHDYLNRSGRGRWLKHWLLHRLRLWDSRTANGVDEFVANSGFIGRRIWRCYRREAAVIHPPVHIDAFTPGDTHEDFYLAASRLVPYKRLDLVVEAFRQLPDRRLVVIGDGPEMAAIRAVAGSNVAIMGYQPFEVLRDHMRRARAFIFPAIEDFGIIPIEAQACGTPVIAIGQGGTAETIRGLDHDQPSGVLFPRQNADDIVAAIRRFEDESERITPQACRANAERFSAERFRAEFADFVAAALVRHGRTSGARP